MKNKWAAQHISKIENLREFCPIELSGEFLPGGSYLPGLIAKYLSLTTKYCKKKNSGKGKNSLEHSIIQGYLISRIQPGPKKDKYFPEIPVIGIGIASGI
jgi:hypothetical protein